MYGMFAHRNLSVHQEEKSVRGLQSRTSDMSYDFLKTCLYGNGFRATCMQWHFPGSVAPPLEPNDIHD
jgi:hypothetical protein